MAECSQKKRLGFRGKNHPFQPMLEPHDAQQRYRSTLRHRRRSPRPRRLAPAAVATAVAALALAASAHALATAARAPPAPLPAHALATAARAPPAPLPMTAAGAHAHAPTHVPAPARNLLSARALLTRRGSPASATALPSNGRLPATSRALGPQTRNCRPFAITLPGRGGLRCGRPSVPCCTLSL